MALISILLNIISQPLFSQRIMEQDSSLNNLVHAENYTTGVLGELGEIKKSGSGNTAMILIAGYGFGAGIFSDLVKSFGSEYTTYAISLPGFGGTAAPPMPAVGTSYLEKPWIDGAMQGILNLIETESLEKPVIVGHFSTGSYLAFQLSIQHPDKIGKIVILGGQPYQFFADREDPNQGPISPKKRVAMMDYYMGPRWFKTVTKRTWDANNFTADQYANDTDIAQQLWDEANSAPLPVLIRYLCEFWAQDMSADFAKVKTPTLVLVPTFNQSVLTNQDIFYVENYFINVWDLAKEQNPEMKFVDIEGGHLCMWKDKPEEVNAAMKSFLQE